MSAGPDKALLYRYAMNQCTAEEKIFVEEWIHSDEKAKMQLELVKNLLITKDEIEATAESKEKSLPVSNFKSMKIIWYLMMAILIIVIIILKISK